MRSRDGPHCEYNGSRNSVVHLPHFGRFGNPEVIHTDRGTAFHNEIIEELLWIREVKQSLTTAYWSEENGIVERATCLTHESMTGGHLSCCLWYSGK